MRVKAWRPPVEGVMEVLHARFEEHAYPVHTHDAWTLMVLDEGSVRYDLDRRERGIVPSGVTLLPPNVAHDGRAGTVRGFAKRVLYLEPDVLDLSRVGSAVDHPTLDDAALRRQVSRLHGAICDDPGGLETAARLAVVRERLSGHLRRGGPTGTHPDPSHARALRDLIDADPVGGVDLAAAAHELGVSRGHLVRSFAATFGVPPHRYLTGRRVDLARRLLLDGAPPATVAVRAGFYDQSHLHRHFTRAVGVPPARFASSAGDGVTGRR